MCILIVYFWKILNVYFVRVGCWRIKHACEKNEQGLHGGWAIFQVWNNNEKHEVGIKGYFLFYVMSFCTNSSYFDIDSVWRIYTTWMSRQMDFDYQDY